MSQELLPAENGEQLDELLEREGRIERVMRQSYYEFGLELTAIHDKQLYKVKRETLVNGRYSFQTWEEYISDRWNLSKQRDHQLRVAAVAMARMEKVKNFGPFVPSCESHAKELLRLESDVDRAAVCKTIIENYDVPTAKDYEGEVTRFIAAREKSWLTLDEWNELTEEECNDLVNLPSSLSMNKQKNDNIEWAQWSWNPVTGCKHDCPYCYAREVAKMRYPQEFQPSIYPNRLAGPENTTVPAKAEDDIAFKNVFTCSMADLFGKWVPMEWITLVLDVVTDNPQWNFLFLTKFPQRYAEIKEYPSNAWLGTTVDCQSRVANAEKAFAKIGGGTKWLSVEPMLTPLKFKKLDLFDWVVFGGASSTQKTPAWRPPFEWIIGLHNQARKAGCSIYHKTNLGIDDANRLREFPWYSPSVPVLPDAMKYLNIK